MNGVRVNVGCGPNAIKGWVNLDALVYPGVMCWDCTRGLPFNHDTVEAIYSEHCFEHFDYDSEAKPFLKECLRCLKPQGTLRIVVPDAGAYLRLYAKGDWDEMAARRPLTKKGDNYRDDCLGSVYRTRIEFINAVFRQFGEHKYAYDAETLLLMLRGAGFSSAFETSYNVSSDSNMALDTPQRKTESLYVEGIKSPSPASGELRLHDLNNRSNLSERPPQGGHFSECPLLGPKRTSLVAPHMSAFGGKADIEERSVRFAISKHLGASFVPVASRTK